MTTFLLTLHAFIVIGFTVRILLRENLSPQARLAWFIILAVLPYIGRAIYFLFGEVDIGNHANARHTEVFAQIRAKGSHLMGVQDDTERLIDPLMRPRSTDFMQLRQTTLS